LASPSLGRARGSTSSGKGRGARSVEIVNTSLLKHPMNWIIIILMVMLFGIGLHLVLDYYNINPSNKQT
jgi:hypothetical protein